jgi:glutamyl/glutaminyl-tRNA synthetase
MIEQEALHTRIAPTPSGYIHLGNAFNFVYNKLLSASTGGTTLLRIDDNDALRSQRAFVEDIFMCLDFLGIEWERGPGSVDEFYDKWSQQHRKPLYDEALSRLKDAGKLFACTCSRSRLQRLNSGVYDGYCVNQSRAFFAEETSWRINTERYKRIVFSDLKKGLISVDVNQEIGSFVVRRKDGFAAYQLVSLIDDLHFGINAVVRGKDLLHSTAMQHLLA